jgi:hypothetical protein
MSEEKCPKCNYTLTDSDCVSEHYAKPIPGDISICFNCGTINKFGESLEIVPMSQEEQREVLSSEHGDLVRESQLLIAGRKRTL